VVKNPILRKKKVGKTKMELTCSPGSNKHVELYSSSNVGIGIDTPRAILNVK
jgi:hypothetical protein